MYLVVNSKFDIIVVIGRKEKAMSDKKKVYVETTVVSDATALPARDIALRKCCRKEVGNDRGGKTL